MKTITLCGRGACCPVLNIKPGYLKRYQIKDKDQEINLNEVEAKKLALAILKDI